MKDRFAIRLELIVKFFIRGLGKKLLKTEANGSIE